MRKLISALLVGWVLAGPGAVLGRDAPVVHVVILEDQPFAPDADVKALLAHPSMRSIRPTYDGFGLAFCLAAWRDLPAEAAECVQSQLPVREREPHVALGTSASSAAGFVTAHCIGPYRPRRTELRRAPTAADVLALKSCLETAAKRGSGTAMSTYSLRPAPLLAENERAKAIEGAASVLTIAVDHVGLPRGYSGPCWVRGRVHGVRRGAALSPRGIVELSLPCSSGDERRKGRRYQGAIAMVNFAAGTFADIYLDEAQRVLDFRRTRP